MNWVGLSSPFPSFRQGTDQRNRRDHVQWRRLQAFRHWPRPSIRTPHQSPLAGAWPTPTTSRMSVRLSSIRLNPGGGWARSRVAQAAAFDLALGRTLHEHLRIIPADAAHDETWSFLTLVVFPDVAVLRFPDMHVDRLIGTPRNVLRRTWFRQEVLGDLLHSTDRPLGEDELVGLFERSALARNRALIRRLAVAVLAYDGPAARSEWARDLYKRVTFITGPRLLDALSDAELDAIIHGTETASALRSSSARASRPASASAVASTGNRLTGAVSTDLPHYELGGSIQRAVVALPASVEGSRIHP